MESRQVPISQGVEFGARPGDVTKGALRRAQNCFYEPESDNLVQLWWRSLFGTIASGQTPKGLGFVQFRSGGKYLIGTAGTKIAAAPVGETGTFTVLKTLAEQAGLMEQVYYEGRDRLYLSDGVNAPQVWDGASAATRDMGLPAPVTAPTLALVSNSATTYASGYTFQYVITEYDPDNDVESGPGPLAIVATSAVGQTVRINLPAVVSSAAKFRIYRTQASGNVWYRLAEVSSSLARYYDGDDSEGLGSGTDNGAVWGFNTMDDIFLASQPVMPMVGEPLRQNYITVNGTIPRGNIMGVFEGSLCISGVEGFPQHIYYSLPDNPECFSPIYYLAVENETGDPVRGFGTGNDRFIVGTTNSIYSYDRLPLVTDPGFGLALAHRREVTKDHGMIAKRAVVQYSVGAPNNRLFYLTPRGPYETDGYATVPLGRDLDWSSRVINFAALPGAVAVNWPKYRVVILCLPSPSSSVNDIAFIYHYDPAHRKEKTGVGKWTGPIDIYAAAAAVSRDADTETRLFIADARANGQVYLEDNGSNDASLYKNADGEVTFEWETDDVQVAGSTRHGFVERVVLEIGGTADFEAILKVAMNKRDEEYEVPLINQTFNEAETETLGTSTIQKNKGRTLIGGIDELGNYIRLKMSETGAGERREIVSVSVEVENRGPVR